MANQPIPRPIDTRAARSEDLDWLAKLFIHAMQQAITTARGSWDPRREDTQFRAQLPLADTRVIQIAGNDIGFLTMRALGRGVLELHTLCIQQDRQDAGIGTHILQTVMKAARADGAAIELWVLKSNTRAQQFYARQGFAEIGASPYHLRMRWPHPGPY